MFDSQSPAACRRWPWTVIAGVLAAVWVVGYATATAATHSHPAARQYLGDIIYLAPIAVAALTSVVAALQTTGRRRRLWWLLVASNLLWLGGDITWATYAYVLHREAPFPSVADALYLASYALVPAAVLVGFGGASVRRRVRSVVDAVVVSVGIGAPSWQLLIAPQVRSGWSWATATGIAYPLLGIVIVVTLVAVGPAGHRRVPVSVLLVGGAFALSAVTDAGYTYLSSLNTYVSGDWLNVGWQAEAVLLCVAAVYAAQHAESDGEVVDATRDLTMVPVLGGVGCAVALVALRGVQDGAAPWVLAVVGITVGGLVARFVLAVADARRVAARLDDALREQERLAVTDGLTGLYNRRFVEEMLRLEVDRTRRGGERLSLLMMDLDHFKQVNDTHGHHGGDTVLIEVATRLRAAVRDSDVVARYGGEEFMVVLPRADSEVGVEIAERCRRALADEPVRLHDGTRVRVTGSFGMAALPDDADDVTTLIQRADRVMYAAKTGGRNRVLSAGDLDDVALAAAPAAPSPLQSLEQLADAVDRRIGAEKHSAAMARWAGVLADALGFDAASRQLVITAARLRDIGKVVVDDNPLATPGTLNSDEWTLSRTHPDAGADLVLGLTGDHLLASVIRAHHERLDGTGYPLGLAGQAIPRVTRLVSVLDVWAEVTADRSHAAAQPVEQARAELRRPRGTQLDGEFVDAFLDLQARGLVGQPHPPQRSEPDSATVSAAADRAEPGEGNNIWAADSSLSTNLPAG